MKYNISPTDRRKLNLKDLKFGMLTAIEPTDKRVGKAIVWKCKCDCGNTAYVLSYNLYRENTKSCGCLQKEAAKSTGHKNTKDAGCSPAINRLYGRYYKNAFAASREFDLSKHEFVKITSTACHYCGLEPSQIAKSADKKIEYIYNGIDRVDSSRGYVKGNIVPCCWDCNHAKSNMSLERFKQWIDRLVKFQGDKNASEQTSK